MAYAAPWIRAWRDFLGDAKVLRLTLAEEGAWWRLLLLTDAKGNVSGNAEEIAPLLRMAASDAQTFVAKLVALGMANCQNGHIAICHWAERQFFSDYSTPRVQRFREKKRSETLQVKRSETDKTRGRPDQNRAEKRGSAGKRARFQKPTFDEIVTFLKNEHPEVLPEIDPEVFASKFLATNDTKGWLVGKTHTPMKNWHSAIATWLQNMREGEFR